MRRAYRRESARVGGSWHAVVTVAGADGLPVTAVDERADEVVAAASVNKLGIACALLDKIDKGTLALDRTVDLTPDLVIVGSGLYHLQTVWGERLTLANVLTTMLVASDNTAVRLCGLVCTGTEVNTYLAGLGLAHTRVEPLAADPRRMYLGTTTAREIHTLLYRLADGTLLSPAATGFLLDLLRSPGGNHDGVRHTMSSAERAATAIKHGADENARHEVGVMFDVAGTPRIVFSLLAELPGHGQNFGATNPLVQARARLGRRMRDLVGLLSAPPTGPIDQNHPDQPAGRPDQPEG
jgi:beta-lactamase class A